VSERIDGAAALWLILSDLEDLGGGQLAGRHAPKPDPDWDDPVVDEAVRLAALVRRKLQYFYSHHFYCDPDETVLRAWARHAPARGLEHLIRYSRGFGKRQARHFHSLIGYFGSVEVDEAPAWTEYRRRRCREFLTSRLHRKSIKKRKRDPLKKRNREAQVALARCGGQVDLTPFYLPFRPKLHRRAAEILAYQGDRSDWPFMIMQLFSDDSGKEDVAGPFITLLERVGADTEIFDLVEDQLDGIELGGGQYKGKAEALAALVSVDLKRYRRLLNKCMNHPRWEVRAMAALMLGQPGMADPVRHLERMMKDSSVREEAMISLSRIDNLAACRVARDHLANPRWRVRVWAISLLGRWHNPALLNLLIPLTRDGDEDVRHAALKAIAPYRDKRVLDEFMCSLPDWNRPVRIFVEQALMTELPQFGFNRLHPLYQPHRPWFQPLVDRVDEVISWGEKIGQELLGKAVKVTPYRQGLGQTPVNPRESVARIRVNPGPMLTGHKHGEEIVKGLILHEIGHHLYDIGIRGQSTTHGIAKSEGLGQIYAILLDERLERNMRSLDPEWGKYLDRLNAHVYNQDLTEVPLELLAELLEWDGEQVRQEIRAGNLPGRLLPGVTGVRAEPVELYPYELSAYPGLQQPTQVFLIFLLCRMDLERCPLPEVVKAIDLVPSNLKDLDHAGVLQLCRLLAPLLGRDKQNRAANRKLNRWLQNNLARLAALNRSLQRMAELVKDIEGTLPLLESEPRGNALASRLHRPRQRAGTRLPWSPSQEGLLRFDELVKEDTLPFDATRHQEMVIPIRRHIRHLQPYMEQLGKWWQPEGGHRKGRRLDLGLLPGALLRRSPRMFIREVEAVVPNCYLGVLIDRSGSMDGERLRRACSFATLLAESARGIPGITGHINAFDDDTFYRLGDFRRHTVASLEANRGNNDSGGLKRAAELALASGSPRILLVMISDGSPSECSVESLENLVNYLTNHLDMICAQVAVAPLPVKAFPHFLDLTDHEFHEAVAHFGRLLVHLTNRWR
jgi:hypothetical protein